MLLCHAQITKGILVPANKDVVLSVLQELDNVKKFGEDSPVIDGFKSFIESLPNQITYQELATKEKQADATSTEEDKFANADEDSLEIFKEAKALAAKEQISFRDAEYETTMSVTYAKLIVDKQEVFEIDVLQNIYKVGMIDVLSKFKKNIGA